MNTTLDVGMYLKVLLIIAFGGAIVSYIFTRLSYVLGEILSVLTSFAVFCIAILLYKNNETVLLTDRFLGFKLLLNINNVSWLFLITISFISLLSIVFSLSYVKNHEKRAFFFLMMLLVLAGMSGVVISGDFLTLFIFWEIMSWATFLLISFNKGRAVQAGYKYIVMSFVGSLCMLLGLMIIYSSTGTLEIYKLKGTLLNSNINRAILVFILFSIAFGIKNAIMPLHVWLPDAHSEAPSPFSAVLSGVLIKVGTYGFILLLYGLIGYKFMFSPEGKLKSFSYIISVLASITIIVPSFIAITQDDAKRLLAWSSVAQVGYIILGLTFGSTIAFMAGVFHFINHALFKVLLFLAVGAVEYKTKTRNLNELGGLIKRMPLTFLLVAIGVSGLIGLPLTNGFISKWMIYKALIAGKAPFMAFAALLGTWGTILYSYKLIHNIFLGQLPEKYNNISDAPFNMQFSMVILSLIILIFGILPGIPLKIISNIATLFGYDRLDISLWGLKTESGIINTLNILAVIVVAFVVSKIIFSIGRGQVKVAQDNNYAAGSYIPVDRYNYTVDFYKPLSRIISQFIRDFSNDFYIGLGRGTVKFCRGVRKFYTGDIGYYVIYIMFFLAILILLKIRFKLW